jgi:hypothetical protein
LYGCSVPVILEQFKKKKGDLEREDMADRLEAFRTCVRRLEKNLVRKVKYAPRKHEDPNWDKMMEAMEETNKALAKDYAADKLAAKEAQTNRTTQNGTRGPRQRETDQKQQTLKPQFMREKENQRMNGVKDNGEQKKKKKKNEKKEKRDKKDKKDGKSMNGKTKRDGKDELDEEDESEESDEEDEVPRYYYAFKGECYLHGSMDGEALRDAFYKDIQAQELELR